MISWIGRICEIKREVCVGKDKEKNEQGWGIYIIRKGMGVVGGRSE